MTTEATTSAAARLTEPHAADALPGELKPLEWHDGRGPISDDEALGVMRRRRRVELATHPRQGAQAVVPDELPAATDPKKASVFRFPGRAMARAHARAEMEGVPLTAILEELLCEYAEGTPQSPTEVDRRLKGKGFRIHRR